MNFLAHSYFSQPTPYSMVGNLLGDFCKGLDESSLHPQVKAGLLNHRAIDKFTDSHPLVLQAKQYFSKPRKQFSGIALDVLFDFYLIKHWNKYCSQNFNDFKKSTYLLFSQGKEFMPVKMQQVFNKVIIQDWFSSYSTLDGVGITLDKIAHRIRFANQFSGSINDIRKNNLVFEQIFLEFFPQLQNHVANLKLEL